MVKVKSSFIKSVGYDYNEKLLTICMKSDRVYHFLDVPAQVYENLLTEESVGKTFNAEIKDKYTVRP